MPFKRILLAVDGSEHAFNAAQYAVELAQALGSKIILTTVAKYETIVLDEPRFQTTVDQTKEKAEHRLAPARELLEKSRISYEALILDGPTAEAIADAAERERADLIVMGSKGHSNLSGLIFGSKAHTLLHIAPCPVLAIRLRHKKKPRPDA